jgi:hypothetical protein
VSGLEAEEELAIFARHHVDGRRDCQSASRSPAGDVRKRSPPWVTFG